VGFVGNMVGVGGGRPWLLLVYWAAGDPIIAAGTSLLDGGLAGVTGTWRHLREGRVDFPLLLFMGMLSVVGAFLGGFFGGFAPRSLLLAIVGIITTWYDYMLLTGRSRAEEPGVSTSPPADEASSVAAKLVAEKLSFRRRLPEMSFGMAIGLFGGAAGLVGVSYTLPP